MKKILLPLASLFLLLPLACKKGPGEGGKASIKGQIWVRDFNQNFTVLNGEYAGHDEDVYIIYGEDVNYGEHLKTNYNGEFEFEFLRPGTYKVYAYSEDSTMQSASGEVVVIREVEIGKKTSEVVIPRLTICK